MAKRGYRLLGSTERVAIIARFHAGASVKDVMVEFGLAETSARRLRDQAAVLRRRVDHSPRRLSAQEREQISRGLVAGESMRAIARQLGRAPSTVSREVRASGGRRWYRAVRGEERALECARRPKATKLSECPRLVVEVERGLKQGWSPQQISARLREDFPDDPAMRISHETIYLSLYMQSRGELRRQLSAQLRTGRSTRKRRGRADQRGQIADMVNISERPAEVEDRAVPGHWEGDLILGAHNRSAVATLVERQTRFVMLAYLGKERTTERVIEALKDRVGRLPEQLWRSLTWDQGREMSAHRRFTVDTGVQVYFCDPHSPWQRGSNENINGLLRQYLPKGTDLSVHDQAELDRIAGLLNGRPRETLGWKKPAEKLAELLAVAPTARGA